MNYFISEKIPKKIKNRVDYDSIEDLKNQAYKYLTQSKYYKSYMKNNLDLLDNLCVSIWSADAVYDEKAGYSKESHRIQWCNWEILRFIDKKTSQYKTISNPVKIKHEQNQENTNLAVTIKDLEKTKKITKLQSRILIKTLFFKNTRKEIACSIGTSPQYVDQEYKKSFPILKEVFKL